MNCSVEGCSSPKGTRGLCAKHYNRWLHWGDATKKHPRLKPDSMSEEEWFWSRVDMGAGCWIWRGGRSPTGYGHFSTESYKGLAHRYAYMSVYGPIPEGLTLDHLCRIRECVRPLHLEPVTQRTNNRRGLSPSAINAVKTHCPRGHEYTPKTTYYRPFGYRECRLCWTPNQRGRRARKRELQNA